MLFSRFFFLSCVPTESMSPTLKKGAVVLILRTDEIRRGDIIAFHKDGEVYIKRVIGISEDTVKIDNGRLTVNGEELKEDYAEEKAGDENFFCVVPENACVVMGDNRKNSIDSRSWEQPFVPLADVIGRAI